MSDLTYLLHTNLLNHGGEGVELYEEEKTDQSAVREFYIHTYAVVTVCSSSSCVLYIHRLYVGTTYGKVEHEKIAFIVLTVILRT